MPQAKITVATEQEPVTVTGEYIESDGGFELAFDIGGDSFTVKHDGTATTVQARGVMAYNITLGSPSKTLLDTPYGKIMFDVKTVKHQVTRSSGAVTLLLGYELVSATGEKIAREVDIHAKLD